MQSFFLVHDELVIQDGVIVKGHRAVSPSLLRDEYYKEAHSGHPGVDVTLAHAQNLFYWPGMTKDIWDSTASCPALHHISRDSPYCSNLHQLCPRHRWRQTFPNGTVNTILSWTTLILTGSNSTY